LKGLLVGKASAAISGLAVTKANYEDAVDLLVKRFGGERTIVDAHISGLIGINPCVSDNLQETYDAAEKHIRGLKALGITPDQYELVLTPILLSKFPEEIQYVVARDHDNESWNLAKETYAG
jgi:hypothetical protein